MLRWSYCCSRCLFSVFGNRHQSTWLLTINLLDLSWPISGSVELLLSTRLVAMSFNGEIISPQLNGDIIVTVDSLEKNQSPFTTYQTLSHTFWTCDNGTVATDANNNSLYRHSWDLRALILYSTQILSETTESTSFLLSLCRPFGHCFLQPLISIPCYRLIYKN